MWTTKPNPENQIRLRSGRHRDPATYEKIMRHLSDINDKINEDDIRNIRIGVYPDPIDLPDKPETDFKSPKAD